MDLNNMYGHKYLVTLDESWDAETPENRTEFLASGEKWWYYEIRGKRGWVYPYNKTKLAVVLPTRAARRLRQLMGPELVLLQHADDERCFKADAKHTAALIRFIKPKRLRQLTTEQKAVLAARLAANRYQKPKPTPKNHGSEVERAAALPGVLSCPVAAFPSPSFADATQKPGGGLAEARQRPAPLSHKVPILQTHPHTKTTPFTSQLGGLYDEKTVRSKPAYPAQC